MRAPATNLWQHTGGAPVDAAPLAGTVDADVVVIGGGFTGCSAALHLAAAGAKVRLLEAATIGHGGSGRNVGLVNAGLWTPPDEVERLLGHDAGARLNAALAAAPQRVFTLIAQHGIDCEATRHGTLHCAHAAAGLADLQRRHAQQLARGAPVQLLDAAETHRRTGAQGYHGALFDARAGTVQPLAYGRGLARAALAAGARLHEHTPALAVAHDGTAWQVSTPQGRVAAPVLVQATDAYEARPQPAGTHTPVHYFQCATAPLPDALRQTILAGGEGCWDTATVMSSFRLDAAGRMILGAVGRLDGFGGGVHARWARRHLTRLFPALAGLPFEQAWGGCIGMTTDHLPKVTRLGPQGVAIHGYSGRGIGPGTVFGEAAAAWAGGAGEAAFPVPVVDHWREPLTRLKAQWFELGSTLTHLVAARRPFG